VTMSQKPACRKQLAIAINFTLCYALSRIIMASKIVIFDSS